VADLSNLSHPSVELQGILLFCSLDSPILIVNLYRHPNTKTPSVFYSNLFAAVSTYKYSLILGDFNAHHHIWGDARIDGQGDAIARACDSYNLLIMNDGLSTFISSSGMASSTIDLSIASRELRILASVSTLQESLGSDSVRISLADTSPSTYRFSNRLNLSDKQLTSLHFRLAHETPKLHSLIFSSSTPLNPLQKYELFLFLSLRCHFFLFSSRVPSF